LFCGVLRSPLSAVLVLSHSKHAFMASPADVVVYPSSAQVRFVANVNDGPWQAAAHADVLVTSRAAAAQKRTMTAVR
jgi:hypothetical protein